MSLYHAYERYTISLENTAQTLIIHTHNLHDSLSIIMECSAGTATVQVSVSPDGGVTWWLVDDIAAALATILVYGAITVGAAVGGYHVAPLSFSLIRIVVGAAGVGNTTHLVVGLK